VSQTPRRRGCALAIIASALALLAFAPGAFAATLSVDGSGNVVFAAGAGETNMVAFDQVDADTVEVTQAVSQGDDSTVTPDGTNCVTDTVGAPGDDNTFTCDNATGNVIATALDGNDVLDASGQYTGNGGLTDKTANFDGGDGDDGLNGGFAADVIHGGNGDDTLFGESGPGSGGADQLFGDAGDDFLAGGPGDDAMDGGAGNDGLAGGPGNDTMNGGDGNDQDMLGGPGNDTMNGGAGDDTMYGDCNGGCGAGSPGNDTMDGGDGSDQVRGEQGDDVVNGGAGNDGDVAGGPGTDTVNGGDGSDNYVAGGPGNDTVDGGAGDDYVVGDCGGYRSCGNGTDGNDVVRGGAGDDYTDADGGTDSIDLGTGVGDQIWYPDRIQVCDPSCHQVTYSVSVTLDGVANDGGPGENDNVVNAEDINVYDACCGTPPAPGNATLVGDAGANSIQGAAGDDTIDGGAGNDFLYGNDGNDTINANDGFADRVSCGDGVDVANVDEFDEVSDNCETVNRTTRGNLATEDAPPTVAFTAPASGAKLSTKTANTLSVTATDDKGISQVIFLANERVICVVKAAPYNCSYKPTDADVGRTAITAVAYDTSQQTASAIHSVLVPRFTVKSISFKTKPSKDTTAPFTFKTSGKINLPSGVTKANGCKGTATITFKAGKKTISSRHAKVSKSCTFSKKVTFSIPSRLHPKTLRVHVAFGGNAVLLPKGSSNKKVKVA
jgi:Ca2+-binding RTX toxin-like protein